MKKEQHKNDWSMFISGMLPFYVSVAVCMSPVRRPYQAGHEIICNGYKAEEILGKQHKSNGTKLDKIHKNGRSTLSGQIWVTR